jgi:nucleoside-diphosphate-sugar epimerase
MRILVTGSAGFIGTHLCRELREAGHHVDGVDIDFHGRSVDEVMFGKDISKRDDLRELLKLNSPQMVIHLAAKVGRLFGEDDVQRTIADNAGITALVAKECGERNIRLVYASTSEVYGDEANVTCYEENLGRSVAPHRIPHNAYGLSKRWGEEISRLYCPNGLTILRLSMPYGPGLPAGRGRAAIINMLWQADNRQTIPVHKASERSWCWVGDTVRGVRMILDTPGGIFNVGRDDDPRPMRQVAEMACDLTGADHDLIEMINPPERQTVVKRLSTRKLRDLGWSPSVSLEEGMAECLAWIREQQQVAA